jgi:galactonate dehydratase
MSPSGPVKIRDVEALPIRLARDHATAQGTAGSPHALFAATGPYQWSRHYPALYSRDFETCLVRVSLSDGRVGWGEAQAPLAPEVPAKIVETLLAPVLVGEVFEESPGAIEKLWWRMYSTMRVRGQTGGFMLDAIAGVDLALWSFLPESPLRDRVEAYVSGLAGNTMEDKLEFARRYVEQGHRTCKVYFEDDWADLLRLIDALGERFPSLRVAVDALWHLPEGREIQCAKDLAARRVHWLECPLVPEDLEGHVRLVEESGVRLALGESYRTRFEALPFFDRDIVTFWQPDLGRSGLTETYCLAGLARERGIAIVPHVSIAMPPQLNAAIRAARSIPNCDLLEFNPSVLAMANLYAVQPARVRDGYYEAGTGPLGGPAWEALRGSV